MRGAPDTTRCSGGSSTQGRMHSCWAPSQTPTRSWRAPHKRRWLAQGKPLRLPPARWRPGRPCWGPAKTFLGTAKPRGRPTRATTPPGPAPGRTPPRRRRNGSRDRWPGAHPRGAQGSRKQRQTARQGISGNGARPQLLQHRKSLTRGGATMMLTRKSAGAPAHLASGSSRLSRSLSGMLAKTIDRRAFLKRSGLAAGAGAFANQLPFNIIGKADAADEKAGKIEVKRSVCTHCSVGCAIDAVEQNGVCVRQKPGFESPLNLGAHCAKGASVREHGMTAHSHRLKYPMKVVKGKDQRISWETAINEIGDRLLAIRKESGPDALYFVGSSKHNNHQSQL